MTAARGLLCVCAVTGCWGCRDKVGDSGSPPITDDSGGEVTTFEGDVDGDNMGEVCADAPGLVEVEGYVTLRSSDLRSLDALSCVNTALRSMEGLEELRTVGRDLRVSGNAPIADLRGLCSPERIGETLSLGRCWDDGEGFGLTCEETGNVASPEGLEQLQEVGGGADAGRQFHHGPRPPLRAEPELRRRPAR